MSLSSIGPKILERISPSIEVQEKFKGMLQERIELIASIAAFVFGGCACFLLVSPVSIFTFEACLVGIPLFSIITSIAMLVLTAYQCKNMTYDEDAEARVKALITEKSLICPTLDAIKTIPRDQRETFINKAELFFTPLDEDFAKYMMIYSLSLVSKEILDELKTHSKQLRKMLVVTPYALPLFILSNMNTSFADKINEKGPDFCQDLTTKLFIINCLETWNKELEQGLTRELVKALNLPKFTYDDLVRAIKEAKYEKGHFTGAKCIFQGLLVDAFEKELGLDENNPLIQNYRKFETNLKMNMAEAEKQKSSAIKKTDEVIAGLKTSLIS